MDHKKLADLLYPDLELSREDLDERYPKRKLEEGACVTRLAPSPTGFIHLGNLYGAFADERLAHQSGGICILRIEDTDRKRLVEGSLDVIIDSLKAYDINFDEGVTKDGEKGDYGPYTQSKRREIYQVLAKYLVEKDLAYPSFQTEEELEEIRKEQNALKVNPGYYGKWAHDRELSYQDIEKKLEENDGKFVLRLKSQGDPEETFFVKDAIRGDLTVHPNDQDIVLIKEDGLPTYHFAHVVDDHYMGITHVVRGEEWLSTLNSHIEIHQFLGWQPPIYCHTAHLMKMEGGKKRKLSKRKDPELSLSYYREAGYHKEAVKTYLMTLMNSNYEDFRLENPEKSVEDFDFDLEKMPVSGALFDLNKLDDISKDVLLKISAEDIRDFVLSWAEEYKEGAYELIKREEDQITGLLDIGRNDKKPRKDLVNASQITDYIKYFFDETFEMEDPLPERVDREEAVGILEDYIKTYDQTDDNSQWFQKIRDIAESRGYAVKMKDFKKNPEDYKGNVADVSTVIRLAIVGRKSSPDVWSIQQIMGEERVRSRVENMILDMRD